MTNVQSSFLSMRRRLRVKESPESLEPSIPIPSEAEMKDLLKEKSDGWRRIEILSDELSLKEEELNRIKEDISNLLWKRNEIIEALKPTELAIARWEGRFKKYPQKMRGVKKETISELVDRMSNDEVEEVLEKLKR